MSVIDILAVTHQVLNALECENLAVARGRCRQLEAVARLCGAQRVARSARALSGVLCGGDAAASLRSHAVMLVARSVEDHLGGVRANTSAVGQGQRHDKAAPVTVLRHDRSTVGFDHDAGDR